MAIKLIAMTRIKPGAEEALGEYMKVVGPLMQQAGATIVDRFEMNDNVVGSNEVQYLTILEYPDTATVSKVFDSDDYKSLENVKEQAFSYYQVNMATTM